MADPAKYKSLSVPREDWEQLGVLATKTNRTRSKMIGRLIRFLWITKVQKQMGKVIKIAKHACICPVCEGNGFIRIATGDTSKDFRDNSKVEQCEQCNSSGELEIQEPTLEFLESFGSKRLQ